MGREFFMIILLERDKNFGTQTRNVRKAEEVEIVVNRR